MFGFFYLYACNDLAGCIDTLNYIPFLVNMKWINNNDNNNNDNNNNNNNNNSNSNSNNRSLFEIN